MPRRLLLLKFIVVFLSFVFVSVSLADDTWEPKVDFDSIFPSYAISMATVDKQLFLSAPNDYIGDINGQLGCEVTSSLDGCQFVLEISSPKFIRTSTLAGTLPKAGVKYKIYPEIDYDFDALYSVVEPIPEPVTFKLTLGSNETKVQKKITQVRSIHDCLLAVKYDNGNGMSYASLTFPAYVNENHPVVDRILKKALDLKLVDSFKGYQGDATSVTNEVYAIWNVMQTLGIKYSSITTPSVASQRVYSQHVRSIEESLNNTQANCVDGSVLFASVYRKIGLKTTLFIVPGHCYMGVAMDKDGKSFIAIETTRIGEVDLREPSLLRGLDSLLAGRKNNASCLSFERAVSIGNQEYDNSRAKFGKTPGYYIIDVDNAREHGIQPLRSLNSR